MPDNWNLTRYESNDWVVFGFDVFLADAQHLDAGGNQEGAKDENDPMKSIDQRRSRHNHRDAHYQRAEDSPIKNAMLILWRDFEIGKNQEEDEQIIDRQRQLNQVPGQELERLLLTRAAK